MSTLAIYILLNIICGLEALELCRNDESVCQTVLLDGQANTAVLDVDKNGPTISLKLDNGLTSSSNIECALEEDETETPLEKLLLTSEYLIFKAPTVEERISRLKCVINNREHVSRTQIQFTKFSNLVQHTYNKDFEFIPNTNEEAKLIVTFSTPIHSESFTPKSAFCLIDTTTRLKASYQDANSLVCDLSSLNGSGILYAVRAIELLDSTLINQFPIHVQIKHGSNFKVDSDLTDSIRSVHVRYNDRFDGLILELSRGLDAGCPVPVPCELFFQDPSLFEYCLLTNLSFVNAVLLQDATLEKSIKVRSPIVSNQCRLNAEGLNSQNVIHLDIETATNPISPIGQITQSRVQSQIHLTFIPSYGCGFKLCNCRWTVLTSEVIGSFVQVDNCVFTLNTIDLKELNVHLEACNFANACVTMTQSVYLNTNPNSFFDIQIIGLPEVAYPNTTIILYPRVILKDSRDGDHYKFKYVWYVNNTIMSRFGSLILQPNIYMAGQLLNVLLSVQSSNENTTRGSMDHRRIEFRYFPLVTNIENQKRSISADESLVIDASSAYNPNDQSSSLSHNWSCTDLTKQQKCNFFFSTTGGAITIPENSLSEGHTYNLTDLIVSETQQTSIEVKISVGPKKFPHLQMSNSNPRSIVPEDKLKLRATVRPNDSTLQLNWTVIDKSDKTSLLDSTNTPNNFYEDVQESKTITSVLDLSPGKLVAGHTYIINLTATNRFGSSSIDYEITVSNSSNPLGLFVTPFDQIVALSTPVQLTLLLPQHDPTLRIRFGVRSVLDENKTTERWSIPKSSLRHHLYLPSTENQQTDCSLPKAFEALVEICYPNGACSTVSSQSFTVQKALNVSAAISQIMQLIQYDIQSNLPFDAYEKFDALRRESCSQNHDLCDSIAEKLIEQLKDTREIEEIVHGMQYLNTILSENICSTDILPDMLKAIGSARSTMLRTNPTTVKKETRQKRNMDLVSAMSGGDNGEISESVASTLLAAYDLLVAKNQNIVTVYLSNLVDLLSGFCVQTDSTRKMGASGQNYTFIQLQGLIPSYKSFLSGEYSLAGTTGKTIVFDTDFQRFFVNWPCSDKVNCSEICLGSAQVKFSVLRINDYMAAYFGTSPYNSVGLNQLVSDLYQVVFMNPIDPGRQVFLPDGVSFTVRIPLIAYKPSFHYKCFTFKENVWSNKYCRSANYGIGINNKTALECTCNSGGFIGVFTVPAPNPIYYPQYNEINITLKLTTTGQCTPDDAKAFIQSLSQATNLDKARFVNVVCKSGGWLALALRPAFRQNQTSNSYAMQSIRRALLEPSGFIAYDSVTVVNVTDNIIYRNLTNDGNARRIVLRIDRSFKDLVGNDSIMLARSWISTLAANMRLSSYRFKNPVVAIGTIFNLTLTVPFAGETAEENKLSAEEIAIWMLEQTIYGELDLRDMQDERMPIDMMNPNDDIIELVVFTHLTSLMIVLSSVVSAVCVLVTFCIGGLVFVKIRTDRLIEKHNRSVQPLSISHSIPMTVLPVLPYESEPLQINVMNAEEENRLDYATDTVVFGKRNN